MVDNTVTVDVAGQCAIHVRKLQSTNYYILDTILIENVSILYRVAIKLFFFFNCPGSSMRGTNYVFHLPKRFLNNVSVLSGLFVIC